MSSEESSGTNSSRLRQFGLYRNIDERTEEFLKLSRKRQIRQGCACAAVSTAITVTIVVSVLIVFEYGFHSDPEPTLQPKHKPNWFSLLNVSGDKFDINQQYANIKSSVLLPLLLKALKQNRILEKAIEEYSSDTPNYEKQATDYPLERNVFTDARNWLRMPPARMYAIEYKTSPIVFFKSRNIDDFSRARKIMDSRRVMNYLHRMMNDKAAYVAREMNNGETDNIVKNMSSTASPKRTTNHLVRLEEGKKSTAKEDTEITTKKLQFNNCNCPSNLKDILQTLILGMQKLFSLNNKNEIVASEDCVSISGAPKRQAKTFVASRRTITTKRPAKVTSAHSSLPLHLFETIIIPKASSTTKLPEILGRTIQSSTEKIDVDSLLNSETTRKQNDVNDTASSPIKLSGILGMTTLSTTGKIYLPSLLNSVTTRKQNDANKNFNETTTFKPYLEVTYDTTTITTTKPMTPVTTEDDTHRVRTTEHFMKRSQNTPVYPPQYLNYDVSDVQINPTTLIPSKVTTNDGVWSNEENEVYKTKTLSNFLFKYKESQKNNIKFEDKRIEMLADHHLDSDTMRTFNARNELIKADLNVKPKIKITKDRKKVKGSAFLKSKSKIAATKDEFGTVIRDWMAWNTVPYNITYGSIRLPNDSNEKPISALPQLSPPFLGTRRNEGRHEEN